MLVEQNQAGSDLLAIWSILHELSPQITEMNDCFLYHSPILASFDCCDIFPNDVILFSAPEENIVFTFELGQSLLAIHHL
jgi:hypothetical protein